MDFAAMRMSLLLALFVFLVPPSAFAGVGSMADPSFATATLPALTAMSSDIFIATLPRRDETINPIAFTDIEHIRVSPQFEACLPFNLCYQSDLYFSGSGSTLHSFRGRRVLVFASIINCAVNASDPCWAIHDVVPVDEERLAGSLQSRILFDGALLPITSRTQLLRLTREEAARALPGVAVISVDAWPFPVCMMTDDDRLLTTARRWTGSPMPMARLVAARIFERHQDPADIPLLVQMLSDPYVTSYQSNLSPWSKYEFPIRQIASAELTARHHPFVPPVTAVPRLNLYSSTPKASSPPPWARQAAVLTSCRSSTFTKKTTPSVNTERNISATSVARSTGATRPPHAAFRVPASPPLP